MCVHVNMTHREEKLGNETTDDEPQLYIKTRVHYIKDPWFGILGIEARNIP